MTRIKFEPPTKIVPIRLLDGPQRSLKRFTTATARWLDPQATPSAAAPRSKHGGTTETASMSTFSSAQALSKTPSGTTACACATHCEPLTNEPGEGFQIGHDFLSVTLRDAPVNMIVDREMTTTPLSQEQVEETSVQAQSTEEILAKKIHLRIIGDRTFHPRDFYDLAWCAQRSHKAWSRAASAVTEQQWGNIRRTLETMPSDWGAKDETLNTAADRRLVANLKARASPSLKTKE